MTYPQVKIAGNYEDLCEKVTQEILAFSNKKIAGKGQFSMVLSGGETPKGIYQCMASSSYCHQFQWGKIHFFWGDERWVAPDDQKSNYHMVSEALLTKVKIPSANIHPIQTKDCDTKASVRLYEKTISDFFELKQGEFPHFDLVLLGIGLDGHTSSLFPGNTALLVEDRLVVAVSQEGIVEKRITLTFPAINHAGSILFVVSGQQKASIVHEVLEENIDFPANKIDPGQEKLIYFLDKASASKLEKKYAYRYRG